MLDYLTRPNPKGAPRPAPLPVGDVTPQTGAADRPGIDITAKIYIGGKQARAEMMEFLGRTVHLFLQVKVRPNWLEEKERFTEMGLDWKDGD